MSAFNLPDQNYLVIGLTGGIGSGKSIVSSMFAEHGAGIIDTDLIARSLTQTGGAAINAICAEFGDEFLTKEGALDRVKMRKQVFSDSPSKLRLEKILHPLILAEAQSRLAQLQDCPYVIIVVPLLPTSPAFQQLVKRVLVVDCDESTQIARVIGRDHISEQEVRDIIAQQAPRNERLRLADDVIHNDGDLESLAAQVDALHKRYSKLD